MWHKLVCYSMLGYAMFHCIMSHHVTSYDITDACIILNTIHNNMHSSVRILTSRITTWLHVTQAWPRVQSPQTPDLVRKAAVGFRCHSFKGAISNTTLTNQRKIDTRRVKKQDMCLFLLEQCWAKSRYAGGGIFILYSREAEDPPQNSAVVGAYELLFYDESSLAAPVRR